VDLTEVLLQTRYIDRLVNVSFLQQTTHPDWTGFAVAASIWAGRVAREIVVQQHVRRLALETEQLASDLGQAVSARLDALRAAGNSASPTESFQRLGEA